MAQLQAMELLHPSVRVLNSSSSFHRACNKKSTHLALGNLPQPELYDKATRFPMVVKDCHSSKGEAVFLCHTHDELRACLLKLQDREILFQEYIAESAGRDVRAFVIGQKSVACIERQAKPDSGEFRANLSLGGTAFKTSLSSAEEEMCIEAVRRVGLDYAGVDFVRATRGSLLLEINPCPGLEGVEKCTGVNVAKELVLYAEGLLTARPER
jgi:ribosomal protein S6--L-glutamate ligase